MPTPPATCKAPVVEFVDCVVFVTVVIPPTTKLPPTPTPPTTCNAPVFVEVATVLLVTVVTPETLRPPPVKTSAPAVSSVIGCVNVTV